MGKKILIAAGVLLALVALAGAVLLGPYAMRVQHFAADPRAGYHSDFYLYLSPGAKAIAERGGTVTVLVQPNNSGTNSDDPSVHRKDAWWTGFGRSKVADALGVALLVPAFPRPAVDWKVYTHALDRDVLTTTRPDLARLDLQLLAMLDHARASLEADGVVTDSRVLMQGFSASGMFANRFTALHPDRVKATAAGSPGGWPIAPLAEWKGEKLLYPAGVADLEQLTGKRFDARTFRAVPQLLVMGALDDNDSLDFEDGWDKPAAAQIDRLFGSDPQARWEGAKQTYSGTATHFLRVPGIGHDRAKLQEHTTRFFAAVLEAERTKGKLLATEQ
jgi:pimeloyl-ACP methyl ester carboxylesterase